jgi:uncharacterized membrane protein YhiD involved in acid resistance
MNQLWEALDGVSTSGGIFTPQNVLLSLLLAFVLGQALAWVYYYTHSGLSYSKTFVQSLVLITVVVAVIMAVIGNNIITAFGLMGALAIIRFRNVIKDTRDIVFVFCALVVGMAAGSQRYAIAIVGTGFISLILVYLHISDFGSHRPHNGFLRFNLNDHIGPGHPAIAVFKRYCRHFSLISAQDDNFGGSGVAYAYQLMIRNSSKNEQMLSELENIAGVHNVSLTMQEQLLEV